MKRVLLLFTFVALVLVGVASADRPAGPCCPAGEAGKARMQGHGEAHHAGGKCCGPKAGGEAGDLCMRGERGEKTCCGAEANGKKACCADGTCGTHPNGEDGCCRKNAEGGEKPGCCQKNAQGGPTAGCCVKAGGHVHGGRS